MEMVVVDGDDNIGDGGHTVRDCSNKPLKSIRGTKEEFLFGSWMQAYTLTQKLATGHRDRNQKRRMDWGWWLQEMAKDGSNQDGMEKIRGIAGDQFLEWRR
ncbi:hypothetical protein LWI29_027438 [Acer saccharum]|uniref:Uncharacterized protein n=1 Tax=Acer saccharum TaxID=4024 RepID=A0AA39TX34_ACESA|nr:hypothetical protein LWI29_027438 [Acer saccharum]